MKRKATHMLVVVTMVLLLGIMNLQGSLPHAVSAEESEQIDSEAQAEYTEDDILFEVTTDKTEYQMGDNIIVTVRATNISGRTIHLWNSINSRGYVFGDEISLHIKLRTQDGTYEIQDGFWGQLTSFGEYNGFMKPGDTLVSERIICTSNFAKKGMEAPPGEYQIFMWLGTPLGTPNYPYTVDGIILTDKDEENETEADEDITDDILFEVITDKSGYQPGEDMKVTVRATNVSGRPIRLACFSEDVFRIERCLKIELSARKEELGSVSQVNWYTITDEGEIITDEGEIIGGITSYGLRRCLLEPGETIETEQIISTGGDDMLSGEYQISVSLRAESSSAMLYSYSYTGSSILLSEENEGSGEEDTGENNDDEDDKDDNKDDVKVTLQDAQRTLRAALGIIHISEDDYQVMDRNGDGRITLADAQIVLRRALNIL